MILLSGHKVERNTSNLKFQRRNKWGQLGKNLGGAEMPVELVRYQPLDDFPQQIVGVVPTVLALDKWICLKIYGQAAKRVNETGVLFVFLQPQFCFAA